MKFSKISELQIIVSFLSYLDKSTEICKGILFHRCGENSAIELQNFSFFFVHLNKAVSLCGVKYLWNWNCVELGPSWDSVSYQTIVGNFGIKEMKHIIVLFRTLAILLLFYSFLLIALIRGCDPINLCYFWKKKCITENTVHILRKCRTFLYNEK